MRSHFGVSHRSNTATLDARAEPVLNRRQHKFRRLIAITNSAKLVGLYATMAISAVVEREEQTHATIPEVRRHSEGATGKSLVKFLGIYRVSHKGVNANPFAFHYISQFGILDQFHFCKMKVTLFISLVGLMMVAQGNVGGGMRSFSSKLCDTSSHCDYSNRHREYCPWFDRQAG
jgi:hypothetical protein